MENKIKAKVSNRGRKVNSVIVNRPDIVQAALAQLNKEAKEELVLRNIKPEDRTTENGLKYGSFVRFKLSSKEMSKRYPDHSLNETYVVRRVHYAFEMANCKESVRVSNMQNEAMGYVEADCLEISNDLANIQDDKIETKPKKSSKRIKH